MVIFTDCIKDLFINEYHPSQAYPNCTDPVLQNALEIPLEKMANDNPCSLEQAGINQELSIEFALNLKNLTQTQCPGNMG